MKRKCKRCKKIEYVSTGKVRVPSEYCNYCRIYLGGIKTKKKKIREHRCLDCGEDVEPFKCPHCDKIVSYKKRCNRCLEEKSKKLKAL